MILEPKWYPKWSPQWTEKGSKTDLGSGGPPGSHFGAILASFWTLRRSIFEPPEVHLRASGGHFLNRVWSFGRTRLRAIQGARPESNLRKLRDDPHSNRPSARAQRACESPAAIVQSRRLAANDALASLALLLLSVLVLRSFLFSDALAPLLPHAVLDALWSLALPVP